MTDKSLFDVLEELAQIELETKDISKDEDYKILPQELKPVEEVKNIVIKNIKKSKGKSGLFKCLSDSLCFVINNCKYDEDELK